METRIVYFSGYGSEMTNLGQALSELKDESLNFYAKTKNQLYDDSRIDEFISKSMQADFVFMALYSGEESCPAFKPFLASVKSAKAKGKKIPYIHIQPMGDDPTVLQTCRDESTDFDSDKWKKVYDYSQGGGLQNLKHMINTMKAISAGDPLPEDPVQPMLQQGIYHPDLDHSPEPEEYFKNHLKPGKPVVGLWFAQYLWVNNNLGHIDMIIREIEKQGACPLVVFHSRYSDSPDNIGCDGVIEKYFMDGKKPRIHVLLNAMSFSINLLKSELKGILSDLGVPIIQTIVSSNNHANWKESIQGINTMDVVHAVAQPEFDGALITMNSGTREEEPVEFLGGGHVVKNYGIPDRVEKLVSLSLNWVNLLHKQNSEKKIAVVFHHNPPRNDRIGCAVGLDTFASVKLLMDRMKDEGYTVDRTYDDGDQMSTEILGRMTYDSRWSTADALADKAESFADRESYMPWHEGLPAENKRLMSEQWGEMPGELFTYNDRLNFAGTVNGNVFITMQPPRGNYEKAAESMIHDMYLSPPHHYLAAYRWMKEEFGADAVIHVGKHGTLEWLPGKAMGLSEECYPDLAIMDLPNIYPYIINDPGEGTQAKRRSYCCIIDHLIPAFTNSGLYEDMEKLDNAIRDYQDAQRQNPDKLPVMRNLVWEATTEAEIEKDLEITEDEAMADFDNFMDKMHSYLEEISDTAIADGLHTMGTYPEGERLTEFVAQLTRLPNGDIPSLRESVVSSMGFDYDELLANRGKEFPGSKGMSGGQIIDEAHSKCVALVGELEKSEFSPESVNEAMLKVMGKPIPQIKTTLSYITDKVVPNIKLSTEEIDATLTALGGKYVDPGPTGAPTRGQADILPTGKNFYSVDPSKLPTPGAWKVGVSLADALIEKSIKETGKTPENVAVYIMGTSTMRTTGDCLAEILYLLGVRPVWQNGGKVTGLEIIPLEELGRARYDVTVRSTGFFRDSFPNLMDMINEAVKMVTALNEPPESNILRKNVYKDVEDYMIQGMSKEDAEREAKFRLFSCPSGTYGAGVKELVETKNWETQEDLGNSYIRWSAHAYGQGEYGAHRTDNFKKVLSRVDTTVQNCDSRESDMFSCTDFYNYYGGLITAVKTVKGEYPLSVYGDSSDPQRVKIRTTDEEARHVFRARLLNPKWIEGLKRHGYKGAGDLSHMMDVVLGWDATAEVVENHMYDRFSDKYALDPEMQKWMKEVNPYALQNIVDKLLEAISRGMWDASPEREEALREVYLDIEGEIEDAVAETETVKN